GGGTPAAQAPPRNMRPRPHRLSFRGNHMAALRTRYLPAPGSVLAIAIAVALAGTAAAQDAPANDPQGSQATRTLDRISVTGSRIKRTDIETALPVTVIQKEEIEAQGIS